MISGERIKQAREIRGLTQSGLAELVGLHQSNIARLEQGFYQPLDPITQGIAMATGFPVAFFRQDKAIDFPSGSLLYRKRASLRSQHKAMLRQLGSLFYEIGVQLTKEVGAVPLRVPEPVGNVVRDAQRMREGLGLDATEPIDNLTRVVEKAGVFVIAIPFEVDEHDAFSLWARADRERPVLVLNAGKSGDRIRFNVAHELGHILLHRGLASAAKMHEREADRFAAEFLMPSSSMRAEMVTPLNLTKLAELKARWGVSIQALLVRALQLEVVTPRQYKYLFQQLSIKGWRTKEPVEIPFQKPRLLRQLVESAYGNPIPVAKVSAHLNVPEKLLETVLEVHAGAGPMERSLSKSKLIPFVSGHN